MKGCAESVFTRKEREMELALPEALENEMV